MDQIRGVGGVGRSIRIAHLLAIAVVGRDQTLAAERQELLARSARRHSSIVSTALIPAGDDAGMADHVRIGKIQNDQVVFRHSRQHLIRDFAARSFPA